MALVSAIERPAAMQSAQSVARDRAVAGEQTPAARVGPIEVDDDVAHAEQRQGCCKASAELESSRSASSGAVVE